MTDAWWEQWIENRRAEQRAAERQPEVFVP